MKAFEAAAKIRRVEKDLLAQRANRIREWSSQVDTMTLAQEVVALHDQIRRFHYLAATQGIDLTTGTRNASSGTEAPI